MHKPIVETPSISQLILSHHLSSTSCWAFRKHVGNGICRHVCNFFRLAIRTHGRMAESTRRIFTEFESAWNFTLVSRAFLFLADPCEDFCSSPVSLFCLRMEVRDEMRHPLRAVTPPVQSQHIKQQKKSQTHNNLETLTLQISTYYFSADASNHFLSSTPDRSVPKA